MKAGRPSQGGRWALAAMAAAWLALGSSGSARAQGGGVDPSFNPTGGANSTVYALDFWSPWSPIANPILYLGGSFTTFGGSTRTRVGAYLLEAQQVGDFDPAAPNGTVQAVLAYGNTQPQILIGGVFTSVEGSPRNRVARLNSEGDLDATFVPPAAISSGVLCLGVRSTGFPPTYTHILAGGVFPNGIVRLNLDGTLDGGFSANANGTVNAMEIVADKILIAGDFTTVNGVTRRGVARLNSNGTLDTSFVPPTNFVSAQALALHGDGILAAGQWGTSWSVARLLGDGSLDGDFGRGNPVPASGVIYALAVQSDSSILLGGGFTTVGSPAQSASRIARLHPDGTFDSGFAVGSGANSYVRTLLVYDDRLFLGGNFTSVNGVTRNHIARLFLYDPPAITVQPADQQVAPGANVTFSVTATGGKLSYQWKQDGANVSGATAASITVTNVQYNHGYAVRVSNPEGQIDSQTAQLTVRYQIGDRLEPPRDSPAYTNFASATPTNAVYWDSADRILYATAEAAPVTVVWTNSTGLSVTNQAYILTMAEQVYTLGQPIPPPTGVNTNWPPAVNPSDAAYWHPTGRKLYATAARSYTIQWYYDYPNSFTIVPARNQWPEGSATYQVHVANNAFTGVDLSDGGAYALTELTDQDPGTGASVDPLDHTFTATSPGRSLILLSPENPVGAVYFQFVQTVAWDHPKHLVDLTAVIGQEIMDTNYHNPAMGAPYVLNPLSRYCAWTNYYDRTTRTGPIIPVNRDLPGTNDDLVVLYYEAGTKLVEADTGSKVSTTIGWPYQPVRYDCQWPTNPPVISIASGQGTGFIDPTIYGDWDLYVQNDPTQPGFNPNDEHAIETSTGIYPLRDDLGGPETSEPYVLMTYQDAQDANKPKLMVFKAEAGTDVYPATAGGLIEPPYPLSSLPRCEESSGVSGPYWVDRNAQFWAKAAGNDGGSTNIVMQFFYPVQNGFYFPDYYFAHFPSGVPQTNLPPAGTHFPWLDLRAGTPTIPRPITYAVTWPDAVPELRAGETLVKAKVGLPDIDSQGSAEIVYEQSVANGLGRSVRLIDPTQERGVPLAAPPGDMASSSWGGNTYFLDLPPHLRSRLYYDPLGQWLKLKGEFIEAVAGESYLLLNVLTARERDVLLALSADSAFRAAVSELHQQASNVIEVLPNSPFDRLALTAGLSEGLGYVTLAFNNNANLTEPVGLEILRVTCPLYRGELKVIESDNPFDEKLTLRHCGDFAGRAEEYCFEWRTLPPGADGLPQTGRPPEEWVVFSPLPADGRGALDITISGAGLFTLRDNYFICRYRPVSASHPCGAGWSEWTDPQLAEGWIKRVLRKINPFEQRFQDYRNTEVNTIVSMISQAGTPYVGNVPLNAEAADELGLIEAYETVLRRGISLSIEGSPPLDDPDANDALLLAAGRLTDLYLLLGNEAYADASDPTIGYGTEGIFGAEAASIHCFQNQTATLLEEELGLLRGRDDRLLPKPDIFPFYNRLIWNFTGDDGEVAYASSYDIRDVTGEGTVNEADAREMYPQGHGDAWGHYLSAIKGYYRLMRNPNFTWRPRIEAVLVGGAAVSVDYFDERKFAQAAAARARAGSETVNLTYRSHYVEDPEGQWQGYQDGNTNRAWGLAEWGSRAGQGAYFDWVVGNALLPPVSTNTGIQKIDRTSVTELREIAAASLNVQEQVDKADLGLNPLGLAKNVVPFDIDPTLIDQGQTHFEQIYDRAVKALNNAIVVFNHAYNSTQLLRRQADAVADFQKAVTDREADFNSRLIEIFGTPYPADIGTGRTYPAGYAGPDLYHYAYVDTAALTGLSSPSAHTVTVPIVDYAVDGSGALVPQTSSVQFNLADTAHALVKPASWTASRQAPGEIQRALSELVQARVRFEQGLVEYDNLLAQIEDQAALLERQFELNAEEIQILNEASFKQQSLNDLILLARGLQFTFRTSARAATLMGDAFAEALPKQVGTSTDVFAPARAAIKLQGAIIAGIMETAADVVGIGELVNQQAKETVQAETNLRLTTLRQEPGILQQIAQLEQTVRREASLRLELHMLDEAMRQTGANHLSTLARGQRLLEDRLRFRQQTAAQIQAYRYKDMAFRIFRNDALQKYRAQFDLAAMYVYLAAKTYDFETNLRDGDSRQPALEFINSIVRARTLGLIENGLPQTGSGNGDAGLADAMARMYLNWDLVLRGQLGFNNPDTETGRFSLRSELFRIKPGSSGSATWREILSQHVVPNVLVLPEFQRYCLPFTPQLPVEPAIVIPFSTTINFGENFFGWPAGGGDNYYDSSHFATKVRSVGVWFANYNTLVAGGLGNTPRIYLVPVGNDVMRSPGGNDGFAREWKILDQLLPVPFPLSGSSLDQPDWMPLDTLSDELAGIRQFASFRAYHDGGTFNASETLSNSRLIGRSVWNTRWLLIIPGGTLLGDRNEGIQRFINGAELPDGTRDGNGVSDIKIFFQTYSYAGN